MTVEMAKFGRSKFKSGLGLVRLGHCRPNHMVSNSWILAPLAFASHLKKIKKFQTFGHGRRYACSRPVARGANFSLQKASFGHGVTKSSHRQSMACRQLGILLKK